MQQKSEKFSEYSARTENLSLILGVNLSDLPEKIGVSNSMFHAYRSGKYPISAKAWAKLEAAERAAGIGNGQSANAENYGNPNIPPATGLKYDDESIVRDEGRPRSPDPLRDEALRKSRERFEKRDQIGSRKLEAVLGEIRERLEDALHSPPQHTETLFAECRTRLDELQNWVVMLKAKPETHT